MLLRFQAIKSLFKKSSKSILKKAKLKSFLIIIYMVLNQHENSAELITTISKIKLYAVFFIETSSEYRWMHWLSYELKKICNN